MRRVAGRGHGPAHPAVNQVVLVVRWFSPPPVRRVETPSTPSLIPARVLRLLSEIRQRRSSGAVSLRPGCRPAPTLLPGTTADRLRPRGTCSCRRVQNVPNPRPRRCRPTKCTPDMHIATDLKEPARFTTTCTRPRGWPRRSDRLPAPVVDARPGAPGSSSRPSSWPRAWCRAICRARSLGCRSRRRPGRSR
jgi:hypothetical protein